MIVLHHGQHVDDGFGRQTQNRGRPNVFDRAHQPRSDHTLELAPLGAEKLRPGRVIAFDDDWVTAHSPTFSQERRPSHCSVQPAWLGSRGSNDYTPAFRCAAQSGFLEVFHPLLLDHELAVLIRRHHSRLEPLNAVDPELLSSLFRGRKASLALTPPSEVARHRC